MAYSKDRAKFGQNFLANGKTVRKLVKIAGYTKKDHILEIGPGDGAITRELAQVAGRVTAIEIDRRLIPNLSQSLSEFENIKIENGDFLHYKLPKSPFSIFANIPFNLTAPIMQKLLWDGRCPQDVYFIMQKEAVDKFVGRPNSTESSIHFQPWFEFENVAHINKFEFRPVPSIDAALIHMQKREQPLLDVKHKKAYTQFVSHGFRSWKKNLKVGYKNVFSYPQWKRLAKDNKFSAEAMPSQLKLEQWLAIFNYFLVGVSEEKKRLIGK
ncbi:MAG: 23S ribosomal RNA methyltransferase Erm [Chloroflexota bacterium]